MAGGKYTLEATYTPGGHRVNPGVCRWCLDAYTWSGVPEGRWAGGQVDRWTGGQVARWPGGQVGIPTGWWLVTKLVSRSSRPSHSILYSLQ